MTSATVATCFGTAILSGLGAGGAVADDEVTGPTGTRLLVTNRPPAHPSGLVVSSFDPAGSQPAVDVAGTPADATLAGSTFGADASADGRLVAYQRYYETDTGDIQSDVQVLDRQTGVDARITNTPEYELGVALSPDGSKLAWVSPSPGGAGAGYDLWVADADGSGARTIMSGETLLDSPDWYPDNQTLIVPRRVRIGFFSARDDLWTIKADGTQLTALTDTGTRESGVSISPDGTQMAFQAYDGGMFGIYVADADGTVTATLVDDASNAATETAWSPDGAQVAWFGVNDQTGRSGAVLTRPADASSDAQVVALPGGRTATQGGFAWVPAGPWDADTDGDGVADGDDNCPTSANAGQTDADGDGTGDVCDANDQDGPAGDADGDGIPNASDPDDTDGPTGDTDNDGVTNTDDNCPSASNAGQADTDGDGTGDACDSTPNGDAPAPTCSHQQATVYVANGTIVGGPDAGRPYSGTLRGTGGRDVIVGTRAADHISSGGGNDLVCGLGASDSITGNGGSDRLIGGPGDDTLAGGAGIDTLQGRDGNDVLTGGAQADRFMGGPGTDTATDFRRSEGDTRAGIP